MTLTEGQLQETEQFILSFPPSARTRGEAQMLELLAEVRRLRRIEEAARRVLGDSDQIGMGNLGPLREALFGSESSEDA